MSNVNRRRFLQVTAAGATFGSGAAAWFLDTASGGEQAASPPSDSELTQYQAFTRTARALGSEVSMTALHPRRQVAQLAVDAAFAELALVESLLSIYRPDSQLCRLNRDGKLDDPHPYFVEVLRYAEAMSRLSGGAFDVTVQPLWALYAAAQDSGTLPDAGAVAAARRKVDWRLVEVAPGQIRLRGVGTAITLNGIAQGYAADLAISALRRHGVEHALVNTGEIGALGDRADGSRWTVGIQHPRHPDAYLSVAKLAGRCLATSGDYATTFSDDFRVHHLFDPRTGCSPEALASVSIAAPTALAADALSTAVFVLGPEAGIKLIEASPDTDALLVQKDGRTLSTRNFPILDA